MRPPHSKLDNLTILCAQKTHKTATVSVSDTLFVNDFETHNTDELIGTVNLLDRNCTEVS